MTVGQWASGHWPGALRNTASMLFIQQAGKTAFIINGLMQGTVNFVNCWQAGLQKNSCVQSTDVVTAVTAVTAVSI